MRYLVVDIAEICQNDFDIKGNLILKREKLKGESHVSSSKNVNLSLSSIDPNSSPLQKH